MPYFWAPTTSRICRKYHPAAIQAMKAMLDQIGAVELSQRLAGQINFLGTMTTEKQVETGGFLIKTGEGVGQTRGLRIVNMTMGEGREIQLDAQEKLNYGEEYMGTVHCHPITPVPSIHDVLTFVADPTEKMMIVHGVDGTINLLIKTEDTRPLPAENVGALKAKYEKGDMAALVRDFNFAYYQGKLAKGQPAILKRSYVQVPSMAKVVSLDDVALAIQGSNAFPSVGSRKAPKKSEQIQRAHQCVLTR
jgi:hypothetical protein